MEIVLIYFTTPCHHTNLLDTSSPRTICSIAQVQQTPVITGCPINTFSKVEQMTKLKTGKENQERIWPNNSRMSW